MCMPKTPKTPKPPPPPLAPPEKPPEAIIGTDDMTPKQVKKQFRGMKGLRRNKSGLQTASTAVGMGGLKIG